MCRSWFGVIIHPSSTVRFDLVCHEPGPEQMASVEIKYHHVKLLA